MSTWTLCNKRVCPFPACSLCDPVPDAHPFAHCVHDRLCHRDSLPGGLTVDDAYSGLDDDAERVAEWEPHDERNAFRVADGHPLTVPNADPDCERYSKRDSYPQHDEDAHAQLHRLPLAEPDDQPICYGIVAPNKVADPDRLPL